MQIITLGPIALDAKLFASVLALIAMFVVAGFYERRQYIKIEFFLWGVTVLALACGRIAFVVRFWHDYQNDWLSIINIRDGGFHWQTALLMAILAVGFLVFRRPDLRKGLAISISTLALSFVSLMLVINWTMPPGNDKAPVITLQDLQHKPVSLIEYAGKPIILNLWATWCPPCRREMPVLQQAQQQYPDLHFVFINQAESAAIVDHFLAEQGLDLENVLLDSQAKLAQQIKSRGLPTTLFIDSDGRVQSYRMGELSAASLHAHIKQLK